MSIRNMNKRICNGICKQFQVKKPIGKGRYSSGQGRCQTCDIWLDHNGCHIKNGSPAKQDSEGWMCNCCNFRIRRNPRSVMYKTKFKANNTLNKNLENKIELTYFNNQRALMIKKLAQHLISNTDKNHEFCSNISLMDKSFVRYIEEEFSSTIDKILKLAYTIEPPNKISMIVELERIRSIIGTVPTKQELEEHSKLKIQQFDSEFGSWEELLNRLNYDPFYRNRKEKIIKINSDSNESIQEYEYSSTESEIDVSNQYNVNNLRTWLYEYYVILDSQNNYDYSYKEMFQRLEEHLQILPKKSQYKDLTTFL